MTDLEIREVAEEAKWDMAEKHDPWDFLLSFGWSVTWTTPDPLVDQTIDSIYATEYILLGGKL